MKDDFKAAGVAPPASVKIEIKEIDLTPPETAISSQPSAVSNQTSVSFTFTCSDVGATQALPSCAFQCKLDQPLAPGTFAACTSPLALSPSAGSGQALSKGAGSYTFTVQTSDSAGNVGSASYAWTVTPDSTPPTSTIATPANGAYVSSLPTISGTASDYGSGIQKVELSFYHSSSGSYFNGTSFAGGYEIWLPANGTASWSFTSPAWSTGNYTIKSRATDVANVVETPGAGSSFYFDNTAPTFSGLTSATAVSATQINLSWSAASDTVTTAPNMVYEVCQSTTSGACASFFTAAVVTSPGVTSIGMNPLSAGTRYYFVVRAKDQAANRDSNAVEKSAGTWSTIGVAQAVTAHLGNHTCALLSDGTVTRAT